MGDRGSREYDGDATVEDSSARRQRPWEQIPIDADATRIKRPWEQIPIEAGAVLDPAAAVEEAQEPTGTQDVNQIRAPDESRKAAAAGLRELAIGDVA